MRALILGSGVIGVTSAWYLRQAGYEVTVIDRQAGPGLETSFANAGQLSFGYTSPWAAPGVPLKALKWLFQKHAPLAIRPGLDWRQYAWLWQMLRNCTAQRYATNKSRMVRVSHYSRDCLNQLATATGIQYEGRQLGTTQLFRTQRQLDDAARDVEILREYGVPCEILDRRGVIEVEPALAATADKLVGALRCPRDQTGDCQMFTQKLASRATDAGVEFLYGIEVSGLAREGDRITGVHIGGKLETADQYVVALGSFAPRLLAPLELYLPVYPLKGYSLTIPILNPAKAPMSTILDESYKVAVTRFNDRIRIGGMAEVSGYDHTLNPRRRTTLEMVVHDWYPGGGDLSQGEFWTGLRPATPDGTPVIGATPYRNLFLNTGHGTLGWTMAAGSGAYLADVMAGRTPAISSEGLDIFRYGSAMGRA